MANRILWNWRDNGADSGCVDEVVLHDVDTVHVEQMNDTCWWIGIDKTDGTRWSGDFYVDASGRLRFTQQESTVKWESDTSHENSKLREVASGEKRLSGPESPDDSDSLDPLELLVEIDELRIEVERLHATIEDTHDDYMVALWEVALIPIAKTLEVDNVEDLSASRNPYEMVDAILSKCKECRHG